MFASTVVGSKLHMEFLFCVKFVHSEKTTKFCKISTLLLSTVHTEKSKVEISQNFVAFSEYMNFTIPFQTQTLSLGPQHSDVIQGLFS